MVPVVVDVQPVTVQRLGEPRGFVLTPTRPESRALEYRIAPESAGTPKRWLKVSFNVQVELAGRRGDRGYGDVSLNTSGETSAVLSFKPVRSSGGTLA